jgi:hypothetical protein
LRHTLAGENLRALVASTVTALWAFAAVHPPEELDDELLDELVEVEV